jgi:hypothetical protein
MNPATDTPTPQPGVKYPAHPICLTFPPIPKEDAEEIIDEMRESGVLIEEIVLLMGPKADGTDDMVLDGRHRQDWCFEAGVEPRYRYFGSRDSDGTSPASFAYRVNTHRRQSPDASFRVTMANALQKFWLAENDGKHPDGTQKTKNEAFEHAAKTVGVSETYVRQAATVEEESPEDYERLQKGEAKLTEVAPAAAEKKKARKAAKAETITASNPAADLVRKNTVEAVREVCGDEFADAVAEKRILTTLDELDAFTQLDAKTQSALVPLLTEGTNLKFAQKLLSKEFDERDRIGMLIQRAKANGGKPLKVTVGDFTITVKPAKKEEPGDAPEAPAGE